MPLGAGIFSLLYPLSGMSLIQVPQGGDNTTDFPTKKYA